ncbi:hypothetical protein GCM10022226_33380 [Sphaerisporangium flaviroseum]|uniref:Uncharacterized protein n=1 Tax=Sphaerisporangium flaviroseum TaxID=509199 RepID=A0ABP7I5Z6_9ACTN
MGEPGPILAEPFHGFLTKPFHEFLTERFHRFMLAEARVAGDAGADPLRCPDLELGR